MSSLVGQLGLTWTNLAWFPKATRVRGGLGRTGCQAWLLACISLATISPGLQPCVGGLGLSTVSLEHVPWGLAVLGSLRPVDSRSLHAGLPRACDKPLPPYRREEWGPDTACQHPTPEPAAPAWPPRPRADQLPAPRSPQGQEAPGHQRDSSALTPRGRGRRGAPSTPLPCPPTVNL